MEAEELFRKGLEYHRTGALQEAQAMYEQALKALPNNEKILVLLGNVTYHLGRIEESVEHYRKAVELNPNYAVAYFNLAFVLEEKRDLDAAIENYKKVVELNPNYAEAYSNLGSLLRDRGDVEGAIKCFQRAIELDKSLAAPREEMEKMLGEVQEQIKAKEAVRLAESHLKDGDLFESEGRLEEAVASYEKAVQVYSNFLAGHFLLGLALEKKGEAEKASKSYEKILSLDPKLAAKDISQDTLEIIGRRLGKIRFTSTDFVAVIEKFHSFERKERISFLEYFNRELEKPEDCLKRGAELEAQDKLEEAIEWYKKAVAAAPFLPTPYYVLGLALEKLGAIREAAESYKKAMELDVGFLAAPKASQELSSALARQIGNVYVSNLDLTSLLKDFKSYIEERRGAPSLEGFIKHRITGEAEAQLKEGFLLDVGGKVDEAISKYEKAIEVDPNNLVAYYVLGLALESRGEHEKAMEHYKKSEGIDLSKAPKSVSPEVIEIINKYMERTTKDGHRVGTILTRYIEIIGENPEKMLRLLSYIEDIKLDRVSHIIGSYLQGELMVEGEGRIIRDKEDFIEDYEEEKLRQRKAKELSKEKVTLLWKYKTARTIRCCALSFNGERAAGGAENGIIYFLNKKGEPVWKAAPNVNIIDIDVSPEGRYVIDCLHSGMVELRDGEKEGSVLWSLDLKESGVTSVALSSNAEHVVLATRDSQIILLDKNGKTIWKHHISGYCSKVDISMDGQHVVACSDEGGVYILRHRGVIPVVDSLKLKDALHSITISPDGSLIAAGSREGNVYLISMDKRVLWKQATLSHVYGVAASTNGKFIAAGTTSGFVYFYNRGGEMLWKYPAGVNIWDVDISMEGTRVAAACGLVFGDVYLFESVQ